VRDCSAFAISDSVQCDETVHCRKMLNKNRPNNNNNNNHLKKLQLK
jgi:hypothetical protein